MGSEMCIRDSGKTDVNPEPPVISKNPQRTRCYSSVWGALAPQSQNPVTQTRWYRSILRSPVFSPPGPISVVSTTPSVTPMKWNITRATPVAPDLCVTVVVVKTVAKIMATVSATATMMVEENVPRGEMNPMATWMSPVEALQEALRLPVAVMAVVAHPIVMTHPVAISPRRADQVEEVDLEEDRDQVVVAVVRLQGRAA